MEALAARSSVLSPPAAAGDASPSPSRIRVSAALPRVRRGPSTLAISTRWPPRREGARGRLFAAGSGEGGSPDPTGDAGAQVELEVLADNNVTLRESPDLDTAKDVEIGISGNGGSNTGGSRAGLFRIPISGGVHSATAAHDLPPPALAVRNLMEQARFAQLCTVMSRMHHRRAGYPFGSLVDFAPDPLGHPIFSLSPLAIHTRNLLAEPRCSLVVQITGSSGLSNTRVSIFGDVVPLPAEQQEWAHQQYVSKHQQWASQQWGNFYYYRMQTISDIYFIGGFGTVDWIDVKEYETLQPDKISRDGGEQNFKELNSMFSKPLKELLSTEGEVDDVAVISMDSKGIDIRVRQGAQYNIQRIAFEVDHSVETLDEVKEALRRIISKSRWHTRSSIFSRP
ncbi:hypothetical protein HU200_046490 [Digitaria exilis]|uniref:CREG-like beta-barrel domain-containing protein n=1 Tax=Digitaria exilis TaxID=1010633 RepID=A0A835EDG7_9POAL|nr:hypothetical protein HU200_046490 [Digitaria exilis]